jgi:acyl-CoA synthetase (AMP-forming)/AMP-acid ligase II
MDVGQLLTATANKFPGRTAVITGDCRFTYQQFNERVNRFAHGLLKLGFKKGDKVCVLLFNSNPFAEVYFATAKLGGATLETLKGGWLHTGDLARMDNEGFIYIVDRKKDMIVSGGENIYPREIEEVLYHHPKIQDALSLVSRIQRGENQ